LFLESVRSDSDRYHICFRADRLRQGVPGENVQSRFVQAQANERGCQNVPMPKLSRPPSPGSSKVPRKSFPELHVPMLPVHQLHPMRRGSGVSDPQKDRIDTVSNHPLSPGRVGSRCRSKRLAAVHDGRSEQVVSSAQRATSHPSRRNTSPEPAADQ